MVLTRRRTRARRMLRRYWRRTSLRPRSRRARSNRLFRRFIRRSNKPELKYILSEWDQAVNENVKYTNSISAIEIAKGTSAGQRVGNQLRLVKLDFSFLIRDNSSQTITAPTVQSYNVRVVVWTPRTDYNRAATYMNLLSIAGHIDYNFVTVYRDFHVKLSPAYMQGTAAVVGAAPFAFSKVVRMKIKFPRKVHLQDNSDLLDEDKDVMFATFVAEDTPGTAIAGIRIFTQSKLWFYDA